MKRTSLVPTLAGLLLAGCSTIDSTIADFGRAPETRESLVGAPRLGRCHMDSCTWFRVDQLALVRGTAEDAFLRADVRWGSSPRPEGDSSEGKPGDVAITWEAGAKETYAYCTSRLPALVAREEDGSWQATRMDLVGTAGALESSAALYAAICHPGENRGDVAFATRHNYRGIDDGVFFIPLRQPDDILTYGR